VIANDVPPATEVRAGDAATVEVPELRGFEAVLGAMLRLLPHRVAAACGGVCGALHGLVAPAARHLARARVGEALPEMPDAARRRLVRRSFRRLGSHRASELSATRFSPRELCRRLRLEGWENLHAATAAGRGVVLLLADLGSWRLALRALVLYRPLLSHFLISTPSDHGRDLAADRWSAMLASLNQGGEVAILLRCPVFGHPASLDPLPARLALASGAPAVLVVSLPEPEGRYRICASPPIAAVGDDTIERLSGQYLGVVEDEIRQHPESLPWWG